VTGVEFVVILFFFGLASGIIGRIKGSSFFVWFLIGFCVPLIGLIAAILYRWERYEPRMRCPRCGATLKISDQVCMRCGEDIVWVEEDAPAQR
jgi:zinc-ribbon domain